MTLPYTEIAWTFVEQKLWISTWFQISPSLTFPPGKHRGLGYGPKRGAEQGQLWHLRGSNKNLCFCRGGAGFWEWFKNHPKIEKTNGITGRKRKKEKHVVKYWDQPTNLSWPDFWTINWCQLSPISRAPDAACWEAQRVKVLGSLRGSWESCPGWATQKKQQRSKSFFNFFSCFFCSVTVQSSL